MGNRGNDEVLRSRDLDGGPHLVGLHLGDQAATEPCPLPEGMGVTNDSQGVGTADRRSADLEAIRAGGKPGVGNDADLVVENHGLSPGITHLLDGVEHHVGGHLFVRVVDSDLDSRSSRSSASC